MKTLSSFDKEALKIALDNLLNGRRFSICDLEKMGDVVGVEVRGSEHYASLSLLHCVEYKDMSASSRAELPHQIMRCLQPSYQYDVEAMVDLIAEPTKAPEPCKVRRLFGK